MSATTQSAIKWAGIRQHLQLVDTSATTDGQGSVTDPADELPVARLRLLAGGLLKDEERTGNQTVTKAKAKGQAPRTAAELRLAIFEEGVA